MSLSSVTKRIDPAYLATSIVVATVVERCRAVYVGADDSYDFSFDGTTWVTFAGMVAGSVYPLSVVGARHYAGSSAPDANDIVFLY
jgi:hypothetical protein